MGLRFRKSVNMGPLRINVSKSGVGYSVGGKGFRVTKKAKGGYRTTASIPGTGISYVQDYNGGKKNSHAASTTSAPSNNMKNKKDKKPMNPKTKKVLLTILGVWLGISVIVAIVNPDSAEPTEQPEAAIEESVDQEETKSEEKPVEQEPATENSETDVECYFKDNVLQTKDIKIELLNHKVILPGEEGNNYGDKPVLAFWVNITNLTDKSDITPLSCITQFKAIQDNNSDIINELNVAALPDESFIDTQSAQIKPGGSTKYAIAYELSDLTTPVTLEGYDNIFEDPIGTQTIEIAELTDQISKPSDEKPIEQKPAETKSEEKTAEQKPAEAKPAEKPAEQKPAEAKPAAPKNETTVAPAAPASVNHEVPEENEYVLNTNTHKFHRPGCSSVDKIKPENYATATDRDAIISQGYEPCKRCNP